MQKVSQIEDCGFWGCYLCYRDSDRLDSLRLEFLFGEDVSDGWTICTRPGEMQLDPRVGLDGFDGVFDCSVEETFPCGSRVHISLSREAKLWREFIGPVCEAFVCRLVVDVQVDANRMV